MIVLANVGNLRRYGHVGGAIDRGRVNDLSSNGLIAGSRQSERIRPSMGARIGGSEVVVSGQDSRGIGTGEVDATVDGRIAASVDRNGDCNRKRCTRDCCLRSREIQDGMGRAAAKRRKRRRRKT